MSEPLDDRTVAGEAQRSIGKHLVEVMVGAEQRVQSGLIGFQQAVRVIILAASKG